MEVKPIQLKDMHLLKNLIAYDSHRILKRWFIDPNQCIVMKPERILVVHPEAYMNLASHLGNYDEALNTLKEIIHHKIDNNYYGREI
jgi:hypothetical protein